MLESMTGFGRGEYTQSGYTAIAELRSVNNRYLETSYRLPQALQHFEPKFKELIQTYIERGKVNISLQLEASGDDISMQLNDAKVSSYVDLLTVLKDKAGIKEPITLSHLLEFKELFTSRDISDEDEDLLLEVSKKALDEALKELKDMRLHEGAVLQKDLAERIASIRTHFDEVKKLSESRIPEVRTKLRDRVLQLIDKDEVDYERLELEITILADKMDISEEIVRMDAHLDYFLENLNAKTSTGRKLNFLLQEMHREANTIGSKANDAAIAHEVVAIKELLENIREQIQNVV